MKLVYIRNEASKSVQAVMLFDEKSGILVGFYHISANTGNSQGIWLVDISTNLPANTQTQSISSLLKNLCAN
ncbi:MAG TPA: hypothetical protein VLZ28_02225 [Daejeonella sp.]|nr:hypothetical protein [Daejeonella sp.]